MLDVDSTADDCNIMLREISLWKTSNHKVDMQTVRVLPRESEVDAGGRRVTHVKAPDCGTCGTPQSAVLARARVPLVFCLGPIKRLLFHLVLYHYEP